MKKDITWTKNLLEIFFQYMFQCNKSSKNVNLGQFLQLKIIFSYFFKYIGNGM